MSCDYTTLDGAYVLGSLAAGERADYERHLAGCAECSRSVRELAGLPGLLARVPEDVLDLPDQAAPMPVPETLLPSLVTAARRDQRRRTTRAALVAAAAVAVIAGGSAALVAALDDDTDPPEANPPAVTETTAEAQRLTPVGGSMATGWVSLTEIPTGTRLDLTCEYRSDYGSGGASEYTLVVRTVDGEVDRVQTWTAVPDEEFRVSGTTTKATPDEIAMVEVRSSYGPVLRLTQ